MLNAKFEQTLSIMLPKINFTQTKAYTYLSDHFDKVSTIHLKDLFKNDKDRFSKFSVQFEDILLDYSKNRVDEETLALLVQCAKECMLKEASGHVFGRSDQHDRRPTGAAHCPA